MRSTSNEWPVPGRFVVCTGNAARRACEIAAERKGWGLVDVDGVDGAARWLEGRAVDSALIGSCGATSSVDGFLAVAKAAALGSAASVGVLHASTEAFLQKSASRLLRDPPPGPPSQQLSFIAKEMIDIGGGARIIEASPSPEWPDAGARRLQHPAALIFLVGHSNGHDARLRGISLCQRPSVTHPVASSDVYPCYNGAPCHFPPDEYVMADASTLRARRVIALMCFGVALPGNRFDPEFSIGEAILSNESVDSLITLIRVARISSEDYRLAYYLCNSGEPMGRVAVLLNRLRLARGFEAEYLCFGDPESRIDSTIHEATAEIRDGRVLISPPSVAGRIDIVARLPSAIESEAAAFVDRSARGLEMALRLPDGQFYATVSGNANAPLVLEPVDITKYTSSQLHLGGIVDELERLETFLYSVEHQHLLVRDGPAILPVCRAAAADVKDGLRRWPLDSVSPSIVLPHFLIEGTMRMLSTRLDALASEVASLCGSLKWSLFPMRVDDPYYSREEAFAVVPCGYCGSQVDERWSPLNLSRARRARGFCRSCGPVYIGNPDVLRWMKCSDEMTRGSEITIHFPVTNPTSVPVWAHGQVALEHFRRGDRTICRLPRTPVAPHGQATLEATLTVPASELQGIHYISAMTCVGASLNIMQRPVSLRK